MTSRFDAFDEAWAAIGEPVLNLARMRWEDDGRPAGEEAAYLRRAQEELRTEDAELRGREVGGVEPSRQGRSLTDDEKVDEAVLESMDASDPPAFAPTSLGSPRARTSRA